MTIPKSQVLKLVNAFSTRVDVDELNYRLYLKKKLDASEEDIRKKRTLPHAKVMKEIARWSR